MNTMMNQNMVSKNSCESASPLSFDQSSPSPKDAKEKFNHMPALSKSAVCLLLLLCLSITMSNFVLPTAVLSGSSPLRLLKLQQDNDAAGAVAAAAGASTEPVAVDSATTSNAASTPSLTLLEMLSSKRRAFWQDAVLQQEIQAHVDCHGKEELLSILYAAGIIATAAGPGKKRHKNNKRNNHVHHAHQQQPTPPPAADVNVTATTTTRAWLMETCPKLAPWSDVTEMYGSQPVVIGMETCARYRQSLATMQRNNSNNNSPVSYIRVAGLYNTGTNSLQRNLHSNLFSRFFRKNKNNNPQAAANFNNNVKLLQVPWGKHLPVKYKYQNVHPAFQKQRQKQRNNINNSNDINPGLVLPIVLVRDPYRWAQTMCKRSYDAKWERVGDHCPNFVRTTPDGDDDDEMQNNNQSTLTQPLDQHANNINRTRIRTYPVTLTYHTGRDKHDEYDSLVDMWSTWHRDYLTFPNNSSSSSSTNNDDDVEPRLLVRFEDLLYHAEEVFSKILECVGVTPESWAATTATRRKWRNDHDDDHHSFKYTVEKTKGQHDDVDFMGALVKYGRNNDDNHDTDDGDGDSRIKGMTRQDLLYAATGRIDGDDESSTLIDSSSPLPPPRGLDPKLMEIFRYRHPPARIDVERKV